MSRTHDGPSEANPPQDSASGPGGRPAFTDIFINRPVLATVISLLILFLGLRALLDLAVSEYPELTNTVITVTTPYPGADAGLVKGFVTTPLQKAIASAEGVDYLTATSNQSVSTIEAHIRLGFDPNAAMTQVMAKVAQVRGELPEGSEDPVIDQTTGSDVALMYVSFFSEALSSEQITDYLIRVVQPQLETAEGVGQAEVLGAQTFAMRVWLDPQRLVAYDLSPNDIARVLRANNFLAGVGSTKSTTRAITVSANTNLTSVEEFRDLVVAETGGSLVRLRDVADVELGAENYDSSVVFNGQQATFIAIEATPAANPIEAIAEVRALLPEIEADLPGGLELKVVYDATEYIENAIIEVLRTLVEALLIVILVIFAFLGSVRSVLIPALAIPLSLVGTLFLMLLMGYSINLLTLLAMVLAIGLVVDDAIIVVENIHRHIEDGMRPVDAALTGARELAGPIIAMTLTLAAVYAPIGFMGGLTGALFIEFAYTLAGAVIISGIVALTLSPMLSGRLLKAHADAGPLAHAVDRFFTRFERGYQSVLHRSLNDVAAILVFGAAVLVSVYFLYVSSESELAPTEDQGVLFVQASAPNTATEEYVSAYTSEFAEVYESFPETSDYFVVNGLGAANNVISGMIFKPWDDRERSQQAVMPEVQEGLQRVAGLETVVFPLPPLPGGGQGLPVEFVITTSSDYRLLEEVKGELLAAAQESGKFLFVDADLRFDRPQYRIEIDRSKANELGITMEAIGSALATLLGEAFVNRFDLVERAYKVIPQLPRSYRDTREALTQYRIRTGSGELIALSTVVDVRLTVQPNTLYQFQQLNSATISGLPIPGVSLGEALAELERLAAERLPRGFSIDYAGQSRQFVSESGTLVITFFFALIVIYLVLAAQFESFRDPLIILVTVPMAISGALIFVSLGLTTINIYSQVGLITLIGIISKHGILMVEFANTLQRTEGLDRRAAIERASAIRLRPILMTTLSMVFGVIPLLLADGPGSESRFAIGLVIATGLSIGTLFTLFVLPAVYRLFGQDHRPAAERPVTAQA